MTATFTDRVLGSRAKGNPFGVVEALLGLAIGFLLSVVAVGLYDSMSHTAATATTFGQDVVSLFALWAGFVGAAVVASHLRVPRGSSVRAGSPGSPDTTDTTDPPNTTPTATSLEARASGSVVADYGLRIKPWPDIPLGIALGVGAQLVLVPLLELPLRPFVHHFNQRIGHPTKDLLGPATTSTGGISGKFVVIAVLVCLGSPVVEELFFRGLLLRGLLGRLRRLGPRLCPAVSIVITGLLFALVHFEALQFLGLAGLGIVLGIIAWRSGRLGPSIVTHVAFNATTVIAWALTH